MAKVKKQPAPPRMSAQSATAKVAGAALGIPIQADANLDISCYETLAQCFVLLCFWRCLGGGRLALRLPALSDNSGAESVCNELYTSKFPLNVFVRKLSMWSSITGTSLECSHISGEKNDDADMLSRWDGVSALPEHSLPTGFMCPRMSSGTSSSVCKFFQRASICFGLPQLHTCWAHL